MPLAILTKRKELHGFLFLCIRVVPFSIIMGLRSAALRAAGAPLKSQLPVFITDEHDLKEIKVLLCTNTIGSSSHNKTLSCNAVTKGFSCSTSHPVQGWMGNNEAFCSHGT